MWYSGTTMKIREKIFLISNLGRVLNVVCFLLGNSPLPEFYILMFIFIGGRWNKQCVPKRRHIKFRRRGITQKKAYNKRGNICTGNNFGVFIIFCFIASKAIRLKNNALGIKCISFYKPFLSQALNILQVTTTT
jgi:hypothetical protein